ncbi:hypothetical protein DB29_02898 [Shouchella clausii]|nr:hypothetical protein DB29_02898 [Shouchella clausii]
MYDSVVCIGKASSTFARFAINKQMLIDRSLMGFLPNGSILI